MQTRTRRFLWLLLTSMALLLVCLAGCVTPTPTPEVPAPPTPTPEPGMLCPPAATLTPTSTATPALPIITEPAGCDASVAGHILFRQDSNPANLYIMDGNGCDVHVVMRNISGAAAWSVDGQRIAVGCEDNQYICILDAPATLTPCLNTPGENECTPVILEKYTLPEVEGYKEVGNIAWAGDGEKLVADIDTLDGRMLYLVNLKGEGEWRLLVFGNARDWDLSPVKDELIFDGILRVPLDGSYSEGYHTGFSPEWSPDGKKIIFWYKLLQDENNPKEPFGLMEWTFDAEIHWRIPREPTYYDPDHWVRRNIKVDSNKYHKFSWSPDGRYIAFSGGYTGDYKSQIFRLDVETGEVVVLTTKFDPERAFVAPAWGP